MLVASLRLPLSPVVSTVSLTCLLLFGVFGGASLCFFIEREGERERERERESESESERERELEKSV